VSPSGKSTLETATVKIMSDVSSDPTGSVTEAASRGATAPIAAALKITEAKPPKSREAWGLATAD